MNVNIPNLTNVKKRPHKQGDVLIQFGIRIVILQSSYSSMSKIYVLSKLHGTKYYLLIFNSFNVEPCNLKWI